MCFSLKVAIKFSTCSLGVSPSTVIPFPFGFGVNDWNTLVGERNYCDIIFFYLYRFYDAVSFDN